jgi:hypothetical protein
VSRRGLLAVALNRWSLGGLNRRWGPRPISPCLRLARDLGLPALRALATRAAGSRLAEFRWASSLFPDGLGAAVARVPLGDVVGVAVRLKP